MFLAGTLAITASVLGQAPTAVAAVGGYRWNTGEQVEERQELRLAGRLP